ncbi:hypothetical protein RUM43_011857 [Polyplax serrata]|uniref:Uncharacterized protein n=1 Tax=Polyplax serrata TaxID=468196 RepID=A0AAN8S7F4_POLSC
MKITREAEREREREKANVSRKQQHPSSFTVSPGRCNNVRVALKKERGIDEKGPEACEKGSETKRFEKKYLEPVERVEREKAQK